MSQLDHEKDWENKDDKQVDDRLPVGKLKWSQKEEEQRTNEVVEAEFEVTKDEEEEEERVEIEAVGKDEPLPEPPKVDKLKNFEDTLSPIDFKEYQVDLEQHQEASAAVESPLKEYAEAMKEEIPTAYDNEEDLKSEDDFKSFQQPSYPSLKEDEEEEVEYRSPFEDQDNDEKPYSHKDQTEKDSYSLYDEEDQAISYHSYDNLQKQDLDYDDEEELNQEPQLQKNPWKAALKILWIPMLLIVALITGLIIGNTVIGGQPVFDIFDWSSWEHLYNLIYQK